jgi:hypothetical protein
MVTGVMEYRNALECRENRTLCGENAVHYIEKNQPMSEKNI